MLVNLYPRCILILVASWSSLHLYPRCIFITVKSLSSLHLDPRCILILVASWSLLHLDPCWVWSCDLSIYVIYAEKGKFSLVAWYIYPTKRIFQMYIREILLVSIRDFPSSLPAAPRLHQRFNCSSKRGKVVRSVKHQLMVRLPYPSVSSQPPPIEDILNPFCWWRNHRLPIKWVCGCAKRMELMG